MRWFAVCRMVLAENRNGNVGRELRWRYGDVKSTSVLSGRACREMVMAMEMFKCP